MHKTTIMIIDTKPYNIMALPVIVKYPGGGEGGGGGGLIKLEMFVTNDLIRSIVGNSVVFNGFFSTNQSDNLRGEPAFS